MQRLILGAVALAAFTMPAAAAHRHHGTVHRRDAEAGMPITAAPDSIRINAVGEVISQPVPIIEKERNFDGRAEQQLQRPSQDPAPAAAPKP